MKIHCKYDELVNPKDLKNYSRNRNKHPQSQIDRLSRLYDHHGIRHAIIIDVDRKVIAAGHGRKLAAIRSGIKEFPVVYQKFETEEDLYAFCQSDNASTMESELDMSGIGFDLKELKPFDLDKLGIPDYKEDVADKEFEGDPDEVPEEVEPVAKLGHIYKLGEHRLMCGDSTDPLMVESLMDGEKADMVFTSPPYNGDTSVGFGGSGLKNTKLYRKNETDSKTSAEYLDFNSKIFDSFVSIGSQDLVVCYNINYNKKSPSEFIDIVSEANRKIRLRETVFWEKSLAISLAGNNLTRIGEFVFIFSISELKMNKEHNECIKNHWKISNSGANNENHKACFPVALPEYGIKLFSKNESIIYEPFGGSGSTLIACEKTNRKCYMMELDPHYVDVIIARWEKFTGKKAELLNG